MTKISQAPNTLRKRLPSFNSGRNNQGRITIRHRVGDHKKLYPLNDYQQRLGIYSLRQLVTKIIYSPYHTS